MCISFPTEMYFHAVSPGSKALGHGKVTKKKKKDYSSLFPFPV